MQCKSYSDFMIEYETYKKILHNYKNEKEKFYDLNFHPQRRVYESEISLDDSQIEWMRIDEIYKAPLFDQNLINIDYVQQGSLGNCSFISAISRIAKDPMLVPGLFDQTADSILGPIDNSINIECGAVVIFFHAYGRKTPVLIDTLIPFNKNTLLPIFSRPINRKVSPWFCLVEKAFAKLQGSYSNIIGVSFANAIYHLFGYERRHFSILDLQKKTPFEKIVKYLSQGAVMNTSIILKKNQITLEELECAGLYPNHSYLIERAVEYKGMRFLYLRNPWGIYEWIGDWSNTSSLWTDEIKHALNINKNFEEGSFWMIEKDYIRYFTDIEISRPIPSDWHSKSFTIEMWDGDSDGCDPDSPEAKLDEVPNFVFQITDDIPDAEQASIYLTIERRSYLQSGADLINKDPSIFYIVLASSFGFKLSYEIYLQSAKTKVLSDQIISWHKFSLVDNKDMITIALKRALKCDFEEECTIRISCKYNFKLYNIDKPDELIPDNEKCTKFFNNSPNLLKIEPKEKNESQKINSNDQENKLKINDRREIELKIANLAKNAENLAREKEEVIKKLDDSINEVNGQTNIQKELNGLIHNIETLDYEDDELIIVVDEINKKRNQLRKLEEDIDLFLKQIELKTNVIDLVNQEIERLKNKIKNQT